MSRVQCEQLYEGNHNEWRSSIENVLKSHSLEHAITDKIAISKETSAQAARIICRHITPQLLQRIPSQHQQDAQHLLHTLRQYARPFRFTDLAAELRNAIYDALLDERNLEGQVVYVESIYLARENKGIRRRKHLPPITQVSRQLRGETRAMFFERSRFCLTFPAVDYWGIYFNPRQQKDVLGKVVREQLGSWVRDVVGESAEYVRSVQVQHSWRYCRLVLEAGHGLGLQTSFHPVRQAQLEGMIDVVNARREEKVDGSGILEVLLGVSEMWAEDLSAG